MKAIIVKKIDTDTVELKDGTQYYRVAVRTPINAYLEEGKAPQNLMGIFNDIFYERMTLNNPETKENKHYFVRVDDRKVWNDLVKVSDSFINRKIEKGIQEFKDIFLAYDIPKIEEQWFNNGKKSVKKMPWYKRLFNRF